jgi:polyhydroxyalkanoate synthesis repressor PhaR
MPVIKRYPNRKLYNTEAKKYVTLAQIAHLIRGGQDVQVVDHSTGEDLTALTLTQVILEQERRQSGFLPQTVLTGLIQAGGDRLGNLRRALASPLELARHVDEEIERRLQALVSRGELAAEEGRRLRGKLLAQGHHLSGIDLPGEQALERALQKRGVPTQDDLNKILEQLEALADSLDQLPPREGSG